MPADGLAPLGARSSAGTVMSTFELYLRDEGYIEAENKFLISPPALILGLHPTNERRCYKVTPSLTGWVQT